MNDWTGAHWFAFLVVALMFGYACSMAFTWYQVHMMDERPPQPATVRRIPRYRPRRPDLRAQERQLIKAGLEAGLDQAAIAELLRGDVLINRRRVAILARRVTVVA